MVSINWDIEWLNVFGSDKSYGFVSRPREVSYERTLQWLDFQVLASYKASLEVDARTGSTKTLDLLNDKVIDEKRQRMIDAIVEEKKKRAFFENFHDVIEADYD